MTKVKFYILSFLFALPLSLKAAPDNTQLAVWANEAIVATYTFDYKNFLSRQKEIAKYFTAAGWTAYSEALRDSKLPEAVQSNSYFVSAVATLPPEIKSLGANQWQADMPLLVIYKNPQYQQKQNLAISIRITEVPSGQGVRGLAITSLQSKITGPACECKPCEQTDTNATTDGQTSSPGGKQSAPPAKKNN